MVEVTGRNIAALLNPRPVILVTCCDSTDTPNVMTAIWHTPISHEPPMVGISVGTTRYSHWLIDNSGEFVLNIVGPAFEDAANVCGNCSGATTDKIIQAGLRLQKSHSVRPPRIADALAYLECRVVKKLPFGDHSFFVASVLYAEAHEGCSAGDWDQLFDKVLLCRQRDQFGRCEPLLRGDTASSSKCIASRESSHTGKSTEIGVNFGTSAE